MRTKLFIPVICLLCTPYALANPNPGDVPFDFSFTAPGGAIPEIDPPPSDNEGISVFSLTMNDPRMANILSIELELTGLSHTQPDDLDIYLIDPFGETLEVMTDRGDAATIVDVTLIFNDGALSLPPVNSLITSGTYLTEGPGGMSNFVKQSGGTDAWLLLVIDDSATDSGSLESWTLRGTAVPEPVTLSLLALGALTLLRRRRA